MSLFYSFDDGGLSGAVDGVTSTWYGSVAADPADAGLTAAVTGNATIGDTCPGSLELTVPFTTVGQSAKAALGFPSPPGVAVTGTALHLALKYAIENEADGAAPNSSELSVVNGAYSYAQAYAQYQIPLSDGAAPDAAYSGPNFVTSYVTFGYNNVPTDGGWLLESVPILLTDGGAVTTPTTVYLNQIYVQFNDPQVSDAGPAPLASPLTVQFFIDDVYIQ